MATFQDRIVGDLFRDRDNLEWGKYWNPLTDDPYTNSALQSRIYNQRIGEMNWQDLLRLGFDKAPEENYGNVMYGQGGGQSGYDLFGTLVNRINATDWTDDQKKSAVQKAIEGHYGQTGSGFTEWTGPEAIARWLGLPDYNAQTQANEGQQFSQAHEKYSAQADQESMANAIKILGGLGAAYLGPGGGLADLFGGGATSASELMAADIATGGLGGAGSIDAATGAVGLGGSASMVDGSGSFLSDLPTQFDLPIDPGGGTFDASGLPNYTSPTTPTLPNFPSIPPIPPVSPGSGGSANDIIEQTGNFTGGPVTNNPLQDAWRNFSQSGGLNGLPTGVTNFLQNLFGGNGQQGGYQFPLGDVVNSIIGYQSSQDAADKYDQLMRYAIERSDPFASQRSFYQGELRKLYENPNSFYETGQADQAAQAAARRAAAMGHNLGTNQVMGVARSLADLRYQEIDRLNPLAGGNISPGNVGSIAQGLGGAGIQQGQQALGNLGFGANSVMSGQQPNFLSQMFGAPRNQNLWQSLSGMFS